MLMFRFNRKCVTVCYSMIHKRCVLRAKYTALSSTDLCRYFEYMFGDLKKHEKSRKKVYDSDLAELQVWITSADPECDGYPSLQTDESCELFSLPLL